jgi:hypothetical protein
MTIATLRWITSRTLGFDPLQGLRVEDPQVRMVLLPIVSSEDIELLLVKGRSVVLYLGSSIRVARLYLLGLSTIKTRGIRCDYPLELRLLLSLERDVGLGGVAATVIVALV